MNENQANRFDKIEYLMNSIYVEFDKLSKKKPDEQLNKFKLKQINDLFTEANTLFDEADIEIDSFELFDEIELPSNSDVVIVLTQYLELLDYYRYRNTGFSHGSFGWLLDNGKSIKTKQPKFH